MLLEEFGNTSSTPATPTWNWLTSRTRMMKSRPRLSLGRGPILLSKTGCWRGVLFNALLTPNSAPRAHPPSHRFGEPHCDHGRRVRSGLGERRRQSSSLVLPNSPRQIGNLLETAKLL